MAGKVKISQDAFQKAISELQTVQNSLGSYKVAMSKSYSLMSLGWKGFAGEAFDAQSKKIINYFDLNITNLEKHINDLKFVAKASAEVDEELARSIGVNISGDPLQVRSAFESKDYTVNWTPGATSGNSTITLTSSNGETQTLKEGEDYYIGEDGKSYFYNNVRAILEANGAKVDYEKNPDGGSIITVTTADSSYTLVEGKDYFVGADGKAHFIGDTHGPLPPGAIQTPAPGTTNSNGSQNSVQKFVEIALSQVGYHEKNKDGKDGSENYTIYGDWYNLDGQPWCAMFVSWCAEKAGLLGDIVPKFASVSAGKKWYENEKRFYSRTSGYEPKVGDTIFFDGHVGIVVAYDPVSKTVQTVEGNSSDQVLTRKFSMSNTYIQGFGSNGGASFGTIS